ncbi:MAG: hypothetical protein KDB70_11760 [Mycobacterium sp.]|nr:hypothetical protein [Mycobacterium sp.]
MGGTINADAVRYLQLLGLPPPPPIPSDPVLAGKVLTEWWAQVLEIASNWGDPDDAARAAAEALERDGKAGDAATKFDANEQTSAQTVRGATADSGIGGQLPQMFSGLGQGLLGTAGSALSPLTQLPTQAGQLAGQLAGQFAQLGQSGATTPTERGGLDGTGGLTDEELANALADELGGDLGDGPGDSSGGGSAALLGPPPGSSAATAPTSGRTLPVVSSPASPATHPSGAGMGAMPMMPGAPLAAGAPGGRDGPSDGTRRVSVPAVRNGAPVQGRINVPPAPAAVTKRVDGKVVATRRIVTPAEGEDTA